MPSKRRRRPEAGLVAMKVLIPSPLLSYTRARQVEADGATLGAVLAELDRRYPGLRFRMIDEQDGIRRHVRFFVNGQQTSIWRRSCGRPTRSRSCRR